MTTVTQQIRHRWTGSVLFECEVDALLSPAGRPGEAVKQALKAGANLTGADLTGANLIDSNLTGANLIDFNLAGANLAGANLTVANLANANLTGANLTDADLTLANFAQANFAAARLDSVRLLDGGLRSDGWRFFLWWDKQRGWRVRAGCRDFTPAVAREHWTETRGGTQLGKESLAILEHLERMAAIRGWDLSEQPKGASNAIEA